MYTFSTLQTRFSRMCLPPYCVVCRVKISEQPLIQPPTFWNISSRFSPSIPFKHDLIGKS